MNSELYAALDDALTAEQRVTLATVVAGPGIGRQLLIFSNGATLGDLGSPAANREAAATARGELASAGPARLSISTGAGELDVFFDVYAPPAKLIIVGAVHVAIPLLRFAAAMGFRTVVVDPRGAFATEERFAEADELLREWPQEALPRVGLDETTSVAVLSHDQKIDVPALELALRSPARYIGALGSKKTHAKRVAALSDGGFTADQIARIHSPIGLDIGGRRAEDIALSVIAEVVAVSHGRRSA